MFNQIELLKAIAATECPRPLTHYRLMREAWYVYPFQRWYSAVRCCYDCNIRFLRGESESNKLAAKV